MASYSSSNYETPIETLWLNNSLKKKRLEREVELLEFSVSTLSECGFKNPNSYEWSILEVRTPIGHLTLAGPNQDNMDWERVLVRERYLELRRLELKNHSLNMRRVLMGREEEVAVAYNKAFTSARERVKTAEGNTALLMGRERNLEDSLFEVRKGLYRKPFYLGRILTNPLNRYSERTDAKDYVNPLFGDLICVRRNISEKAAFSKNLKDSPNNLDWFSSFYWNENAEATDSKLFKNFFVTPLKAIHTKEDNFQKFVKERAEMVDKTLMPTARN